METHCIKKNTTNGQASKLDNEDIASKKKQQRKEKKEKKGKN